MIQLLLSLNWVKIVLNTTFFLFFILSFFLMVIRINPSWIFYKDVEKKARRYNIIFGIVLLLDTIVHILVGVYFKK